MSTYDNFICAVPLENKGIANYIIDSLRRKFSTDYSFSIKENVLTNEYEIWCRTNFEPKQIVLDIIHGKSDWRA